MVMTHIFGPTHFSYYSAHYHSQSDQGQSSLFNSIDSISKNISILDTSTVLVLRVTLFPLVHSNVKSQSLNGGARNLDE